LLCTDSGFIHTLFSKQFSKTWLFLRILVFFSFIQTQS